MTATAAIIVHGRESRRSWLSTVAIIHHADRTALALAIGSFALSVAAMYVGLPSALRNPAVDPSPLDSLGALSLCVPASLHAALLGHRSGWLQLSESRRARLRTIWFLIVGSLGAGLACICGSIAPPGVAATHVLSLWALWFGLGTLSCIVLGSDLAIVVPITAAVLGTIPAITPIERNPIYNLELAGTLRLITAGTVAIAFGAYRYWGDANSRRAR